MYVFDRWTDGQTDKKAIARPRVAFAVTRYKVTAIGIPDPSHMLLTKTTAHCMVVL